MELLKETPPPVTYPTGDTQNLAITVVVHHHRYREPCDDLRDQVEALHQCMASTEHIMYYRHPLARIYDRVTQIRMGARVQQSFVLWTARAHARYYKGTGNKPRLIVVDPHKSPADYIHPSTIHVYVHETEGVRCESYAEDTAREYQAEARRTYQQWKDTQSPPPYKLQQTAVARRTNGWHVREVQDREHQQDMHTPSSLRTQRSDIRPKYVAGPDGHLHTHLRRARETEM